MAVVPLVLVGGGGHASDLLQAVEAANAVRPTWHVVGILDDADVDPRRFAGRGVTQVGGIDDVGRMDAAFVVCVGWPWSRQAVVARIGDRGEAAPPIVHPGADVGAGTTLGPGSVVLGGAHVSPMVRLGPHSLVSYLASVGHDTVFGAVAAIMPGAAVSGDVVAGDEVLVGTNATILEGRRIGDRARVGAGAVVVDDVAAGTTVIGIPARPSGSRHD